MISAESNCTGNAHKESNGGSPFMHRVILCDDDERFLEELHDIVKTNLDKRSVLAKIHSFCDPSQIGDQILESCDVAVLDIDFPAGRTSGLDLARKIRQKRDDTIIIFLTNYVEYAVEGYEVQAFRYLLKCDVKVKLPEYLFLAFNRFSQTRRTVKIKVYGELIDIPVSEITYIEVAQHQSILHVKNEKNERQYTCYKSLTDLESELKEQGFLRTHKSYLVNMRHIKVFLYDGLTLQDGTKLRVGGKMYATQKERYLLWKGQD